ncbi:unnamed protein product [marine sediment metagenome]|uniref:Uncharacterized protein n=1 Tax=marine sediment metagenome TaxID=412755 RepID=X1KWL1_9ZZZZ
MSLPAQGSGLFTGRARTERGMGTPLTEAERLERHYATESNLGGAVLLLAVLAAAGFIVWATSKKT